jgi:hypothetical protein
MKKKLIMVMGVQRWKDGVSLFFARREGSQPKAR